MNQIPTVGRDLHYVAPGSADGKFPAAHRAAKITDVRELESLPPKYQVRVCVFNPTGIFFSDWLNFDEGCGPQTVHWPERV